jgi:hypothetical protein
MFTVNVLVKIIGVLMFGALSFGMASSFANQDGILKHNLATDIQMFIETLVSFDGDSYVFLDKYDASDVSVVLTNNQVIVSNPGDLENEKVRRVYFLPQGYQISGAVKGAEMICLKKENQIILLEGCQERNEEGKYFS